ncbi:MAG: hypothetical protein RLY40_744 [Pseudomonadota bacterium]|jgi:hypothetical protein
MLANKIYPTPDNPDNSVYILNLSTIHELAPISTVLDNFAKLHYDYAQAWLHFEWYSKLWVSYHYLKMIGPIKDYKLGKIDSNGFIKVLQDIFYFLPPAESAELLKNAWNSLIVWNAQSTQRLNYLIEKNQGVNLISNTNELNIQKIKQDIDNSTGRTWDWQKQTSGKCHFQVYENFRLMTSYENGVFKTDGLLEELVTQLVSEGHNPKRISLVSQYKADLDTAKTLEINSLKPNEFFPTILEEKSLLQIQPKIMVANNLYASSQQGHQARSFFVEQPPENNSETDPLLLKPKP